MKTKITALKIVNGVIRKYSYWYNAVLFADCGKFWTQKTFNLDVVNLGSSSGKYAFDFSDTGLRGANWAMAPQSLVADFAILKTYCSFLKPQGGVVLVPLCPFSCLGGGSPYLPDKYYTVLNMSSIPNSAYQKQQEVYAKRYNPVRYYPALEMCRDFLYLFHTPQKTIPTGKFRQNAESFMKGWMHEFSISDFRNPLILKNQDAYAGSVLVLAGIIQFCLDKGFRPVVVVPPVTRCLSSLFSDSMREKFIYSFVKQGSKKDAEFLDYFEDPEFADTPRLFRNSFFLNKEGAKLFTRRVLNDIGQI